MSVLFSFEILQLLPNAWFVFVFTVDLIETSDFNSVFSQNLGMLYFNFVISDIQFTLF